MRTTTCLVAGLLVACRAALVDPGSSTGVITPGDGIEVAIGEAGFGDGSGSIDWASLGSFAIPRGWSGRILGATASRGGPDPMLLPQATTSQLPRTEEYEALGVPGLAAGDWYEDPTTGVRIFKLTSSSFPAASDSWVHDYADGGEEISLPYAGDTRSILVRQRGGPWWLVDFAPASGGSNARQLTGNLAPFMDMAFTFSTNPATPYYAYVSRGDVVRRIDIRSMTEAPGDGWPVSDASAVWLHQSEGDALFVWMRGANGPTVVAYEPSSGIKKTYTNSSLNEPRIDRAGRYVAMSMDSNGLVVWDWNSGAAAWTSPGDPGIPFSHNASLRRRFMVVDWNMTYPPDYAVFDPAVAGSFAHVGGPANGMLVHGSGNWLQHPKELDDQWALFSHYGSLRPAESYWLAPGGMILVQASGGRRLLAHPYNTSSEYALFPFAKLAPDGRYVLFTSDMNGAPRTDLFLAELPVR